ncbi:MAG: NAD(P)H-dependent flavin oxidoreductase [Desulfatibacillaceae bacterium]
MIKTRITELFGIEYPIIGGTMAWISNADFVAAMSEAGGLGVLASANYHSREEFAEAIDRIQSLTKKPFAVNINLFPSMRPIDNNDYVDVLGEKGVKIVETSGHSAPEDLCKKFRDLGMTWMHKCVGVRYALKVQSMGADVVTVVGYENGGATGRLDIGTLVLVPSVVDAVDLPVIGGGGVSDGRGLMAVLSLGAEGVIMGTRLLMTKECPIHENLKQALVNASELDTMLIMRSLNATHRVWENEPAKKCAELESCNADFTEVFEVVKGDNARVMYDTGDLSAGIVACGQGVGLAHDIPSVKELFDNIMRQAEEVKTRLAG